MPKFIVLAKLSLILIVNDAASFVVKVAIVKLTFRSLTIWLLLLPFEVQPIISHILPAFKHIYLHPLVQTQS